MYASLIVLLVTLIFFGTIGVLIYKDVVVALLNGIILYLLLYRAYFDLMKGRYKAYVIGLVVGVIVALLLPPLLPLWDITLVVIVTFIVVELLRIGHRRR